MISYTFVKYLLSVVILYVPMLFTALTPWDTSSSYIASYTSAVDTSAVYIVIKILGQLRDDLLKNLFVPNLFYEIRFSFKLIYHVIIGTTHLFFEFSVC